MKGEPIRLAGCEEQEATSHEGSEKSRQQVPHQGALPPGRASNRPEANEERHDDASGAFAQGQRQRVPAAGLITIQIPEILDVDSRKDY